MTVGSVDMEMSRAMVVVGTCQVKKPIREKKQINI
jgi:hypothetical protein